MCGFDELEDSLTPEERELVRPEIAVRDEDNYGFGEPDRHQPHLQWARTELQNLLTEVAGILFAPLRRLLPKG